MHNICLRKISLKPYTYASGVNLLAMLKADDQVMFQLDGYSYRKRKGCCEADHSFMAPYLVYVACDFVSSVDPRLFEL